MMTVKIVEREFQRQSGPRRMYGFVRLSIEEAEDFRFESLVNWPSDMDNTRYETAIRDGIVKASNESGLGMPVGHFKILEVRFSEDDEANVPFAYGEAARRAFHDFLHFKKGK